MNKLYHNYMKNSFDDKELVNKLRTAATTEESMKTKILLNLAANRIELELD